MLGGLLAHVRRRAERGQVRAHEREEIGRDRGDRAADGPPAVRGDALRGLPIRRDFDKVARDKPDAHVGHEAEQLRYGAERQADVRERFSAAREVEELGDVVAFGAGSGGCRQVNGFADSRRVSCGFAGADVAGWRAERLPGGRRGGGRVGGFVGVLARCWAWFLFGHSYSFPIWGFCAARFWAFCRRGMPLASYLGVTYHARKPWQTFLLSACTKPKQ